MLKLNELNVIVHVCFLFFTARWRFAQAILGVYKLVTLCCIRQFLL